MWPEGWAALCGILLKVYDDIVDGGFSLRPSIMTHFAYLLVATAALAMYHSITLSFLAAGASVALYVGDHLKTHVGVRPAAARRAFREAAAGLVGARTVSQDGPLEEDAPAMNHSLWHFVAAVGAVAASVHLARHGEGALRPFFGDVPGLAVPCAWLAVFAALGESTAFPEETSDGKLRARAIGALGLIAIVTVCRPWIEAHGATAVLELAWFCLGYSAVSITRMCAEKAGYLDAWKRDSSSDKPRGDVHSKQLLKHELAGVR
jgi:hypothetical protein